ncbi:MAG: hypothetical protein ACFCUN_13495 [Hyphomicrobiaceae bacterium]
MAYVIAVLIGITIVAAAYLARRPERPLRVEFDGAPDTPVGFGHDMTWIAVRARSPDRVAAALGLDDLTKCNWSSGVASVYDRRLENQVVFISPAVDGWVFIVARALPLPASQGLEDRVSPLLDRLGTYFVDCQYFAVHPGVDTFAWVRRVNGVTARAFAVSDSERIWDHGRTGQEEKALGLQHFEMRGVAERKGDVGGPIMLTPTVEHVLKIAARWSFDPTRLGALQRLPPAAGYVAPVPPQWRSTPRRIKRQAAGSVQRRSNAA